MVLPDPLPEPWPLTPDPPRPRTPAALLLLSLGWTPRSSSSSLREKSLSSSLRSESVSEVYGCSKFIPIDRKWGGVNFFLSLFVFALVFIYIFCNPFIKLESFWIFTQKVHSGRGQPIRSQVRFWLCKVRYHRLSCGWRSCVHVPGPCRSARSGARQRIHFRPPHSSSLCLFPWNVPEQADNPNRSDAAARRSAAAPTSTAPPPTQESHNL